jgi:HK97 family phage prohead protease
MEYLLLKAAVTTTDQGVFEAVISTGNIDRENDIVEPAGLVKALRQWNRPIPLTWHHSTRAEDIFGSVDGQSAKALDGEVAVTGQVDLESPVGQQAWRSMKARSVGFSFGFLIPDGGAVRRKGGGLHIHAMDVFEITASRAPINNDTRILSTKAATVCETCGQPVGQKASDSEPELPALSDDRRSATLPADAGTGTSDAKQSDSEYWDDLRRESHRLATSVLLGE